jgi:hypothetical protein
MTTEGMKEDNFFRIRKEYYILSLPPERRAEKAAGSW